MRPFQATFTIFTHGCLSEPQRILTWPPLGTETALKDASEQHWLHFVKLQRKHSTLSLDRQARRDQIRAVRSRDRQKLQVFTI